MFRLLPRNESNLDRALRVLAGLALLVVRFTVAGPVRWVGLIGVVPLTVGLIGSCPLYTLLGVSTCPLEKGSSEP